jgi:hypothetical protein
MAFGNFQELLCGGGRLSTALLPLLQGAFRNIQRHGKLRLRQPALAPHINDARLGFNALPLSTPGFDLLYTVQDFLPHVAFGLEFGESLTS